jgi:hypothetical protein
MKKPGTRTAGSDRKFSRTPLNVHQVQQSHCNRRKAGPTVGASVLGPETAEGPAHSITARLRSAEINPVADCPSPRDHIGRSDCSAVT